MPHKMNKEVGMILIVLGLVGTVLLFPLKLDKGKTCLAHQYLVGESGHDGWYAVAGNEHALARTYVVPYGLLWWTSLGLSGIGLYFLHLKRLIRADMNRTPPTNKSDSPNISRQTKEGENHVKHQDTFKGDMLFLFVNIVKTQGGVIK